MNNMWNSKSINQSSTQWCNKIKLNMKNKRKHFSSELNKHTNKLNITE